MGKSKKVKADGKKKIKDLGVKDSARSVAGGRKAGGTQENYLTVKLNEVFVSSV
jgi:hypothetical protein